MGKFKKEFSEFIAKGNVVDLAVGLIIGGMFTKIVNSVVNDILMPFISLLTKSTNFANMFITLDGKIYATIEEATAAKAAVLAYGNLIQLLIDFLLTALCLFFIIKGINTVRKHAEKLEADRLAKKGIIKTEEPQEEIKD